MDIREPILTDHGFEQMLQDMKDGKINCVIVKDLSRFGRNYIQVGNYLEQIFPLFHTRFIAINDQVDNEKNPTSADNILIPFKNLLNDEYCRDTSLKIRSALEGRKRKGEFVGAFAPYGYQKSEKDKHQLEIDEAAARIVRKIFEWYVWEGVGKIGICQRLNEMGIENPSTYKKKRQRQAYQNRNLSWAWTPSTITKILKNEVYLGHTIQGKRRVKSYKIHQVEELPEEKWIRVEHTHEPIIEQETFQKAQEMGKQEIKVQTGKKTVSKWAGLLRCADCKEAMHRKSSQNATGKRYDYYVCSTYQKKSKHLCTKHRIRINELEEVVEQVLQEIVKKQVNIKRLSQMLQGDQSEQKQEKIVSKQKEIQRIEKRKQELYEDWKNGDITKEEYHQYKQGYQEEIIRYQKQKEMQKQTIQKEQEEQEAIEKQWQDFQRTKKLPDLSRELLVLLVKEIQVQENGDFQLFLNFSKNKK